MTKPNIKSITTIVIVALLAFIAWNVRNMSAPVSTLLGANECASGQTCLPSLELTGPNSGVTNVLQLDSGIFNNAGTFTQTGAATFASSVTVSGATVVSTFTQGGGIRATSTTNTAETLVATDFDTESQIDYTANTADTTVTLPASSTLSAFIPTAGQRRTVCIRNATTTAATDLTIAGGTGTLLKQATSTDFAGSKIIYGDTDGQNKGCLIFTREANSDITALFNAYRD